MARVDVLSQAIQSRKTLFGDNLFRFEEKIQTKFGLLRHVIIPSGKSFDADHDGDESDDIARDAARQIAESLGWSVNDDSIANYGVQLLHILAFVHQSTGLTGAPALEFARQMMEQVTRGSSVVEFLATNAIVHVPHRDIVSIGLDPAFNRPVLYQPVAPNPNRAPISLQPDTQILQPDHRDEPDDPPAVLQALSSTRSRSPECHPTAHSEFPLDQIIRMLTDLQTQQSRIIEGLENLEELVHSELRYAHPTRPSIDSSHQNVVPSHESTRNRTSSSFVQPFIEVINEKDSAGPSMSPESEEMPMENRVKKGKEEEAEFGSTKTGQDESEESNPYHDYDDIPHRVESGCERQRQEVVQVGNYQPLQESVQRQFYQRIPTNERLNDSNQLRDENDQNNDDGKRMKKTSIGVKRSSRLDYGTGRDQNVLQEEYREVVEGKHQQEHDQQRAMYHTEEDYRGEKREENGSRPERVAGDDSKLEPDDSPKARENHDVSVQVENDNGPRSCQHRFTQCDDGQSSTTNAKTEQNASEFQAPDSFHQHGYDISGSNQTANVGTSHKGYRDSLFQTSGSNKFSWEPSLPRPPDGSPSFINERDDLMNRRRFDSKCDISHLSFPDCCYFLATRSRLQYDLPHSVSNSHYDSNYHSYPSCAICRNRKITSPTNRAQYWNIQSGFRPSTVAPRRRVCELCP